MKFFEIVGILTVASITAFLIVMFLFGVQINYNNEPVIHHQGVINDR